MSEERTDEMNSKLGNYIAYGLSFGLLGGGLFSVIGVIIDNAFIQIAAPGIGLSLGTIIGALYFSLKTRNRPNT